MTSHLDPPELHSRELLAALGRHHVRFLVVGGFAAQPWSISTSLGWRPGSRRDALRAAQASHPQDH